MLKYNFIRQKGKMSVCGQLTAVKRDKVHYYIEKKHETNTAQFKKHAVW